MQTIREVLEKTRSYFEKKGLSRPQREAEEVLAFSLRMPRIELYIHYDRVLDQSILDSARKNVLRRAERVPLQYLEGEVEFYGCCLTVNEHVLIPRQETELLVDLVVREWEGSSTEGKVVWDVCCGSGCIGIALKKRFPSLKVYLSDISAEALRVAEKNACKNDVEVHLLQGDLFAPFGEARADYILSNPPYISESEYPLLEPEVRDYEPKGALLAGENGTAYYRRFARDIKKRLLPGGKGYFEIGSAQREFVREIFEREGGFTFSFVKDWSAADRYLFLHLEGE